MTDLGERDRLAKTRREIIADARRIRADIEQTFADVAHWNAINPNEQAIVADPDGTLRRMAARIDALLAGELHE